ncbi:MAG: Crp/Fnr family transcriptional regulator [Christensenellaceae bacterium]|jgi:CRP-like cAMP-binding protein|nr:Crp/Fnr family transcriptional regulator [Christensenellaceae bacterium]
MKNSFAVLKQSALFHGISEDELGSLIKCLGGTFRTYKKGETIYRAGDFVREIGIVLSGRVHIIKEDAWGNANIIAEISCGEMFAEAVVCGGVGVLPVTALAAMDTEVIFVDFQRIITTCSSACVFHPLLIRNMIGVFARRNIMLAGKMEHITKRTTREKLLSYLSEQSKLNANHCFEIPFNRQELADYLSVERSALSAEMSKLKVEGMIDYRKNHFELPCDSLN